MKKNCFEVIRGGIHTTFQDCGYFNVQHMGITTGGAVDISLFRLANKIVNNALSSPVLEFSIQGPKLKLKEGKCRFVVTGNVAFNIIYKEKVVAGISNRSYLINEGDKLDILATVNSNYGYLAVEGGFFVNKYQGCSSTLTQSEIGPNNGKKILDDQTIYFYKDGSNKESSLDSNNNFFSSKNNNIVRVLKGPQMNYFMQKVINNFYLKPFIISNTTNRMGIRIEGNSINSIKSHNISSEGIVRGSIQVPGNGDPIILMTEHPSIGGYPKIAIVILADIEKVAQFPVGTKIFFKEVSLLEAEYLYIKRNKLFKSLLHTIEYN